MAIDIERVRFDTPGCQERIHFNNAGASLMPRPVLDTVIRHLELEARVGGYEAADSEGERIENVYRSCARLIGCRPDEIALLENATRAWDAVFYALPFQPGDRIVTGRSEYGSNYMAYLHAAHQRGVDIVVVDDDEDGQIDLDELQATIDDRVKLISLTHVPTNGGLVNPAVEVGRIARAADTLFLLDACQSVGQMPIDVKTIGCDFLATTGRKFMRGPRGTGFLYVDHRRVTDLHPHVVQVGSAEWTKTDQYTLKQGARRFETWEVSYALQLGLGRAIDYALEQGIGAIWERVAALGDQLREKLATIAGISVHDRGKIKCGIVTFTAANVPSDQLLVQLQAQLINVDISTPEYSRLDFEARRLRPMIRASVHYFNTTDEIDRFCEIVAALSRPQPGRSCTTVRTDIGHSQRFTPAPTERGSAELAAQLAEDAAERLLRYVRIDTQSDEDSESYPSTEKQLDLLRLLRDELLELGLVDAALDEHGYVTATLPATVDHDVPTIAFFAHVDTASEVTGTNVNPQRVRYEGGDIPLGDSGHVIRPEASAQLSNHVGHELLTTDGTTLLGADDKAGVAEIMAAAAYLVAHPEVPHGTIKVAFNPDEEVGRGVIHFPVESFGAAAAYTMDGSTVGEIQEETFSGAQVRIRIRGRSIHPGLAKGELVNAIKLAAALVERLPKERLSPETTDGHEGYVHPKLVQGDASELELRFIIRDFDNDLLDEHIEYLRMLAEEIAATDPRCSIEVDSRIQYRNMRAALEQHPQIVENLEAAVRRIGLEPKRTAIRGGTDGSTLTEMGLPTPNIYTGGQNAHSEREWICVEDMGIAVATIVELAKVWAGG